MSGAVHKSVLSFSTKTLRSIRAQRIGRFVAGLSTLCLVGLGALQAQPAGPQGPLPVSVIEAQPTNIPNVLEVTAQAEGAKETEVRSRVNGILLSVCMKRAAQFKRVNRCFKLIPNLLKLRSKKRRRAPSRPPAKPHV
jgi:hypothetical protein